MATTTLSNKRPDIRTNVSFERHGWMVAVTWFEPCGHLYGAQLNGRVEMFRSRRQRDQWVRNGGW